MEAGPRLQAAAAQSLRLAALDPARARALATPVVDEARGVGAWEVVSSAERALGVAAMNLSDLEEAVRRLSAAVAAAERAGSRRAAGEARMSLASAFVLRGLSSQASREIQAAMRDLDGIYAARARVQYAAILQELGRNDAALVALRGALPVLRRHEDAEWAARALSNRSLIHAQRRAFRAAEADLVEARRHCDEHGLELPGAYAEQNLGCLDAQRGNVPAALGHFDAAQVRYDRYGLVEPSLFVDRAHVLLSVRLLGEARTTAEEAVSAYQRQKRDVHLPEAQLLLSTVALVQGDAHTAGTMAAAAARGFRRLGRTSSLALARYAGLQATLSADPRAVGAARAAHVADELEAGGWTVPALEARVLAGRVALAQGRRSNARRYLAGASRARFTGPADARSRAWLAEALLRRADGRRPAALAALRAGLRIVDEHQATLPATEVRAHVSVHRGALARVGLRMALEDRNARAALWWAERDRSNALLLRPPRPPDDPVLARDLADLRSTMTEIDEARADDESDVALVQRQLLLERRVRDRSRTLNSVGARDLRRRPGSMDDLLATLGDTALVEYVEMDGALHAVTVAGGRVRLHVLGPLDAAREAQAHVPFALHRLARPHAGSAGRVAAATSVLRHAADTFDAALLRPLLGVLRDRPLVVVPTRTLQSLPWSILPSCAGRPVTISPSAALWHRAMTEPRPPAGAPVVVVAGPGLPGATTEAQTIAGLYGRRTLLVGRSATSAAVVASMDGAAQVHLAAHGSVRSDNPLFSSVTLADGPLTVYELERLAHPPAQVTLAACDTGRPQAVTGEEILGFGAALLSGGTATLVAPVVPVSDAATVRLMRSYHEGLVSGRSPAEALAVAQTDIDRRDVEARAAAAGFVCLGAG